MRMTGTGDDPVGTYRIDTEKRPMQMFWTVGSVTIPGIFELQGDRLVICVKPSFDGKLITEIPKTFDPGPETSVMVFTREH
jgi:uncharacterized protein (TIGR03067 family)